MLLPSICSNEGRRRCRYNKEMDKSNYKYLKDILSFLSRGHGVRNMEWLLTYLLPVWAVPNRSPLVDPKMNNHVVKNEKFIKSACGSIFPCSLFSYMHTIQNP